MDKIISKQILGSVLQVIKAISDKEYQGRVWIRAEGPECSDFDETCNDFFGDCDPVIDNWQSYGITREEFSILELFHREFDTFSRKHCIPEKFIDTPEWTKITQRAQEVLKVFNNR